MRDTSVPRSRPNTSTCYYARRSAYVVWIALTAFPSLAAIFILVRDGGKDLSYLFAVALMPLACWWLSHYRLCLGEWFLEYRVFPFRNRRIYYSEILDCSYLEGYADESAPSGPIYRIVIQRKRGRPLVIPTHVFGEEFVPDFLEFVREKIRSDTVEN